MSDRRVIAGVRAVGEALRSSRTARTVQAVLLAPGLSPREAASIEDAAGRAMVRVERAPDRATLDRLAGDLRHQGVVAVAGAYAYEELDRLLEAPSRRAAGRVLLALDQVTDPHNFGAMIRSAVALGVDGLVVTKDRAAPVSGAVVRASAGATEHARIARVTNLARALRALRDDHGLAVLGLDAEGDRSIAALTPPPPAGRVLVVGSEGRGLRRLVREACDQLVAIPLPGPVASLNASVAASLAIYEVTREVGGRLEDDGGPSSAAAADDGDGAGADDEPPDPWDPSP